MGDRSLVWEKVGENIWVQLAGRHLGDLGEGDTIRICGFTVNGNFADFVLPLHWVKSWPNGIFWLDGLVELDSKTYSGWFRVQLEIDQLHTWRSSLRLKPDSRPAIHQEDFLDIPTLIPALK